MGKHTQITEATTDDTAPNGSLFYDTDASTPSPALTQAQGNSSYANRIATTTDNGVPRFDGTTGTLQTSGVTIGDDARITTTNSTDAYVDVVSTGGNAYVGLKTGASSYARFYLAGSSTAFGVWRYNDSGVYIDTPLSITRSNGRVTVLAASTAGLEFGSSGPLMLANTGAPSGVSAPVGSTYRQTDANTSYGSLVGIRWIKIGTGTALNIDWYPDFEGRWVTYTPTITTGGGSGLTTSSVTGSYTQVGKLVHLRSKIVVSAVGTATGAIIFTLPTNTSAAADQMGYGRQDTGTGVMLQVRRAPAAATKAEIWKYDNSTPIAVQTNVVHYTYEVA